MLLPRDAALHHLLYTLLHHTTWVAEAATAAVGIAGTPLAPQGQGQLQPLRSYYNTPLAPPSPPCTATAAPCCCCCCIPALRCTTTDCLLARKIKTLCDGTFISALLLEPDVLLSDTSQELGHLSPAAAHHQSIYNSAPYELCGCGCNCLCRRSRHIARATLHTLHHHRPLLLLLLLLLLPLLLNTSPALHCRRPSVIKEPQNPL